MWAARCRRSPASIASQLLYEASSMCAGTGPTRPFVLGGGTACGGDSGGPPGVISPIVIAAAVAAAMPVARPRTRGRRSNAGRTRFDSAAQARCLIVASAPSPSAYAAHPSSAAVCGRAARSAWSSWSSFMSGLRQEVYLPVPKLVGTQPVGEPVPRAVQPHGIRRPRAPERLRGLFRGQVVPGAEREHLAVAVGQLRKRAGDDLPCLVIARIAGPGRPRADDPQRQPGAALLAPVGIGEQPAGGAEQPADRRLGHVGRLAEGGHEHLLEHVLRGL